MIPPRLQQRFICVPRDLIVHKIQLLQRGVGLQRPRQRPCPCIRDLIAPKKLHTLSVVLTLILLLANIAVPFV